MLEDVGMTVPKSRETSAGTCFSTFWNCYPYIVQHFNGNVFILLFFAVLCHIVSIKAYNSTIHEFYAVQYVELYGGVGAITT